VTASSPIDRHAILVGLPGAGKTTIGRMLAERLRRPFLDFDDELVRRAGMSVSEIFQTKGEAAFRQMELELSRELSVGRAMVLSPGGGWAANTPAVTVLRGRGSIIYLRADPQTVLSRLGAKVMLRPLLSGSDPKAQLEHLFEVRREYYEAADVVVDTQALRPQQVTDLVLSAIQRHWAEIGPVRRDQGRT
jgi:shikimate kinase